MNSLLIAYSITTFISFYFLSPIIVLISQLSIGVSLFLLLGFSYLGFPHICSFCQSFCFTAICWNCEEIVNKANE